MYAYAHLYGRGQSDAPTIPMTDNLFVAQTANLLYALGLSNMSATFVGYSMGTHTHTHAHMHIYRRRLLIVVITIISPGNNIIIILIFVSVRISHTHTQNDAK